MANSDQRDSSIPSLAMMSHFIDQHTASQQRRIMLYPSAPTSESQAMSHGLTHSAIERTKPLFQEFNTNSTFQWQFQNYFMCSLSLSPVILYVSADCAHVIMTEWQCFWWKCEHCEVWEIIITMNYGKIENLSSGSLWWSCLMGPPLRHVFVCIRFSVGP